MDSVEDFMEHDGVPDTEWMTHPPIVFVSKALKGGDIGAIVGDYGRLSATKRVTFTSALY